MLIAIYLGACRAVGRRPTRRQAMWFALAMGAIFYTHTGLDEYADARIFSMHMLQHLMQTFVIPPLLLLGTPGWMLRPWVLSRPVKPVARMSSPTPVIAFLIFSAVFVTAHFPPIFDQDVPRRKFSHLSAPVLHGGRRAAVVADPESAARAAAALLPGANPLPVPADDPDDRGRRADHARDARDLSVVHSKGRTDGASRRSTTRFSAD